MPDDRGTRQLCVTHQAAKVIDIVRQAVAASFRPFGIAVAAQIGRHDMEMRLQFARDRIPVAAMVEPAMDQDQRRRGFVAPVGIVQPQPLGLANARSKRFA
jgi:hypothetical protein